MPGEHGSGSSTSGRHAGGGAGPGVEEGVSSSVLLLLLDRTLVLIESLLQFDTFLFETFYFTLHSGVTMGDLFVFLEIGGVR